MLLSINRCFFFFSDNLLKDFLGSDHDELLETTEKMRMLMKTRKNAVLLQNPRLAEVEAVILMVLTLL